MVAGRDAITMETAEGESYDEGMAAEEMPAEDVEASKAPSTVDPDYEGERLVVRNVSMRILVDDVVTSVETIRSATESAGGIVSVATGEYGSKTRSTATRPRALSAMARRSLATSPFASPPSSSRRSTPRSRSWVRCCARMPAKTM